MAGGDGRRPAGRALPGHGLAAARPAGEGYRASAVPMSVAIVATLAVAALVPLGLPLPWVVILVAVPPAVLVAIHRDHNPNAAPVD